MKRTIYFLLLCLCLTAAKAQDDAARHTGQDDAARYIGLSHRAGDVRSPLLRQRFDLTDRVDSARLSVNSLGYHEVYLNGRKVGDGLLTPAVSQLNKRSLTVTYDLKPYLRKGENELLLWLGTGWYKKTTYGVAYDGPLVKAWLDVKKKRRDAWTRLVNTDRSWSGRATGYSDTGTWQALQFGGERIDARLIPTDLSPEALAAAPSEAPGAVSSEASGAVSSEASGAAPWGAVQEVDVPAHQETPQLSPLNTIQETLVPQSIQPLAGDTVLIDMGKTVVGWFSLRLPSLAAGHELTLDYSDCLEPNGAFHEQGQRDRYIASGAPAERFCNRFNYHAFRYVRIAGLPRQPRTDEAEAYLIHTDFRQLSTFECSDADLNAIHNMIQYTMRCLTLGGYMVDCPHLERAGYGGDGNSSTESLQLMFDVQTLYDNWLQTWADAMRPGGSLPHVAPNPGAGGGGPYWCGFIVMAPWRTYLNYGDPHILAQYYEPMQEWLGYVARYTKEGLLGRWPDTPYRDWFLGDWLPPMGVDVGNPASVSLTNNCFISQCFDTMAKIARLLGKPQDADRYTRQRDDLNRLIHATFYHPETATYATGSQLDMVYPMLVGATPPALYDRVKTKLIALVNDRDKGHIGVGLVGVPILTEWATANKAVDLFYTMMKRRDYPGYLYMIDRGATTTWEYWSGERSRVHNCYNGIGTWFYRAVAGIRIDESQPAYRHIIIEPQIPHGVTWAKASVTSPYGKISVDWSLDGNRLNLLVTLPKACTYTLNLPEGYEARVKFKRK